MKNSELLFVGICAFVCVVARIYGAHCVSQEETFDSMYTFEDVCCPSYDGGFGDVSAAKKQRSDEQFEANLGLCGQVCSEEYCVAASGGDMRQRCSGEEEVADGDEDPGAGGLQKRSRPKRFVLYLREMMRNPAGVEKNMLCRNFYCGRGRLQKMERDILFLAKNGADICFVDGRLYDYGDCPEGSAVPKRDVALAMFDVLSSEGSNFFALQVELYHRGYRTYSGYDFRCLELALAVGCVHPCCKKFSAKGCGDGVVPQLQQFWETHQDLSDTSFKKAVTKISKDRGGALRVLRRLKDSEILDEIRDMNSNPLACDVHLDGLTLMQILDAWSERTNEVFDVEELMRFVGVKVRFGDERLRFLRIVLPLVKEGVPIVYNRNLQKLTLLKEPVAKCAPQKGRNLATMMFDFLKHNKNVLWEELLYQVYHLGYDALEADDDLGVGLKLRLRQYGQFFVILDLLSADVFPDFCRLVEVLRRKKLWGYLKEKLFVPKLSDVQKYGVWDVTEGDLYILRQLKIFLQSPSYVVLKDYVPAHFAQKIRSNTDLIKDCLCVVGAQPAQYLWRLCRQNGMQSKTFFWKALQELFCNEGLGVVKYDLVQHVLFWDAEGSNTPLRSVYRCAKDALVLYKTCPGLHQELLCCVLTQLGYASCTTYTTKSLLCAFDALGLKHSERKEETLAGMRKDINFAVKSWTPGKKYQEATSQWNSMVANRVLSWLWDGTLWELLEVYQNHRETVEKMQDADDGPTPCKRPRREYEPDALEVIREHIPTLYAYLLSHSETCPKRRELLMYLQT